jgi:CRP/FNR family transcriptional regulator, cyclic AMP receptor protein
VSSTAWIRESLASSRLLSELPAEALNELTPSFLERSFLKGEPLCHQGDPGESLFIIGSGQVKVEKEILDGSQVTLAIRGPGSVIGELALLDGAPRSATVVALTPVKALSLAQSSFLKFISDHGEALKSLLGILSHRLRESDRRIEDLGSKTVPQRLAGALLELAATEGRQTDAGIELSSTVNYQLLSGLLCTNRESVSRAMRDLRDEGLTDKVGRSFVLTDLQGLSDRYGAL